MRIFCDFIGHGDLAGSINRLFADRLGYRVDFPDTGPEWVEDYGMLNAPEPYVRSRAEVVNEVSMEQYMDTRYDAVIATSWQTELPMGKLFDDNGKSTHFIRHIGNIGEQPLRTRKVMLGLEYKHLPNPDLNVVQHLPEHSPAYIPSKSVNPPETLRAFASYTAGFDYPTRFISILEREFDVAIDAGDKTEAGLIDLFQKSLGYIHLKGNGGCGFTIRQALSCGLPVIVNKQFCRNFSTLAESYLIDSVNCIDIDPVVRTFQEGVELLKEWTLPDRWLGRKASIADSSSKLFDFHGGSLDIKDWLEKL